MKFFITLLALSVTFEAAQAQTRLGERIRDFFDRTRTALEVAVQPSLVTSIFKDQTHFKRVGSVESFQWAPARYKSDFRYDIFYYIPASLQNVKNASALIFNHGGGQSTLTREGSIRVVGLYMNDLRRMADELNIVVVLPSANGLNWGGHTHGLIRELATMIRTELNVDPNKIGVSGHSMGGMGITRSYIGAADEVAFYMPMAAGMDVAIQSEEQLNKVFNVPYVHLQGRRDHFDVFITRCEEQLRRTRALEYHYERKSKFEMVFYEGNHNYDFDLFKRKLQERFAEPRDLYQKQLFGALNTLDYPATENNILFNIQGEPRYFWFELTGIDNSVPEGTNFRASISGNRIDITMPVLPKQSKGFRVYLHSKMVNLSRPVEIYLNQTLVATRAAKRGRMRNYDLKDPGFLFEDAVDVKF